MSHQRTSLGPETGSALPRLDPASEAAFRKALGLKALSVSWAKAEIVLGLTSAVLGLKFLLEPSSVAWAGGVLMVLGLYLAMAGHRSHLYLAMNRQNAYLVQRLTLTLTSTSDRTSP